MSTKWEKYFKDRHWREAEEYTGTVDTGSFHKRKPVRVVFDHGKFRVENGVFRSPLSANLGAHGVLLQEVDRFGNDIPGSLAAFGELAVRQARREWQAIW